MLNIFKSYKARPSIQLRNRLVELNINLARSVAHSLQRTTTEPYEDLEQVAILGLIKAVERFEPQAGCTFSTYAIPTIKGKILQYLRDKGATIRIPQNLQSLYIKKLKTEARLHLELGRKPSNDEIRKELDVESSKYNQLLKLQSERILVSLSTIVHSESSKEITVTLEDTIHSPTYHPPQDIAPIPSNPLGTLQAETKDLLTQLFLENKSRSHLAKSMGMSHETAKAKLRTALEEFARVL